MTKANIGIIMDPSRVVFKQRLVIDIFKQEMLLGKPEEWK